MKKKYISKAIGLIIAVAFSLSLSGQTPTYLLELRNDVQTSSTSYEFDIYILRTGTTAFEYAAGQYGITINPNIKNGGTISAAIVSGSSDAAFVTASQNPTNISYYDATNVIRIGPRPLPGSGAIISSISPGLRLCRVRLSNTVDFSQYQPNLTWTTNTIYPTQVSAYISGVSTVITNYTGHTVTNLVNPVLNPPVPAAPLATSGSGIGCTGFTSNWNSSSTATSYRLDVSTSSSFSSFVTGYEDLDAGNVTSYGVTGLTAGVVYYYRVRAVNTYGTSASSNTITCSTSPAAPVTPGTISGTTAQCEDLSGQIYSISLVPNASSYTWTVPTGWSITSGQGTTSITVTTGSAGENGNITVYASNTCGLSSNQSLSVSVISAPAVPGTISGTIAQCPGRTGQIYSVASVSGATSYTWTVPSGWSITAGQGTASITVTTGAYGNNGNITVSANNSCGSSTANTLVVTVQPGTPATPGTISGTAAQCPGLTGQIYSIASVTNATTYTWAVPSGWSITSGQGTTSITVTTGAYGNNGNITVTAGNSCGTSAARALAVTILPGTPSTPGAITGTTAQCPGLSGQIYSISSVTGASTYTWTVPSGWSISNGQGTTSITVTTGSTGQGGNITVTAGNSCGTSSANSLTVTVQAGTPSAPGAITGTATQCPARTGQVYSISSVANATTYTWTVPTGWSITSGQGTTSITVTTGAYNQNGNITVTAGNTCGTSTPASLAVTVSPGTPATPGTITGTTAQCPGLTGQTYSIGSVANATTYTWTLPSGWSITAGQGTTSITVTTGLYNQNGNITVTAGNSCGTSATSSLAVTVLPGTPSTPGTISGMAAQCPGLTGQTYSISAVSNATTYAWSVPTGWSITGGQGTTSITVTTGSAGQNGNISVTAGNSCGTSTPNTLAVTVQPGTPVTPGTITGTSAQCPGLTGQIYGISAVTNATTYNWTIPTGWSITAGQGTTSITVTTGAFGNNGNITVTAGNTCGTSAPGTLAVTVQAGTPSTPGAISGTSTVCPGLTGQTYSISSVANASTYTWSVPTGWTITSGQGTTSILVTTGSYNQNGNISVTAGNSCGTSAARTLAVTVQPGTPAQPGTISGTETQCPGLAGQIYSISTVANATTYTWSVPTGWTITAGQGTTSVAVTTGSAGQNGNISVTAGNSCGTSILRTLAVTVQPGTPATPGTITGTSAQCPGLTGQVYSISSVANASTYTWSVPTGWTITAGQGTTSLTVTTGSAGQGGNITVTAGNSCGTSSFSSLGVTINPGTPSSPGTISGISVQCPGLIGQVYSIGSVTNATTYNWSVPTGWSISAGQGSTSISVTTGSAGQGGNITVTAGNSCGTSAASSLAVTVSAGTPSAPVASAGSGAGCSQINANWAAAANASSYRLDVSTINTFATYVTGFENLDVANVTSYTVTGLTAGTVYYYRVRAVNGCGTSGNSSTITYSTSPATPSIPGSITGTIAQCPGLTGQVYNITTVPSATTYTWTVPTGWSISSGQGTVSISVSTGSAGQNGNITVTAGNSCGTSTPSSLAVTVSPGTPAAPGSISGTAAQCPGLTGQIYSISAVTNATTYNWTVPTGWSITGGQGTTSITVTTGSAGQNGNINVTAGNSCGTSTQSTLVVTVLPGTPAIPGTITGTTAQCPGLTGQIYSISAVTNATTYTWTLPSGWTINSGQGTTSISASTGTAGQNGNITVAAGNSCGTSSANTLAVTVQPGTPATPGTITGNDAQCPSLTSQVYTVSPITNATTYTWSVPTGWSITGGQGTTSLTVTTGTAGQNGNITVTAGNSCGTSAPSSLGVTVLPGVPSTPGTITGTVSVCPGITGITYSISTVTNATTYTWNVPTGWTITAGQGTTSVTVTSGSYGQNGNISVTAGNSCGTSTARTRAVTVLPGTPSQPEAITGTTAQCPGLVGQDYSISSVTNATTYTWSVPSGWTITAGQGTTAITVTTGLYNQNGSISVTAGNSCGTSTPNTLSVTVSPAAPSTPGSITGTAAQCPGLSGQIYSIASVTNATTYTWSVPTGWSITAGQNSTSITVTTGSAGQNGNISVTAGNSCGTSTASTLAVTVGSQSTAPTGISISNNNTCSGTSKTLVVTGGSLGTGASWEWFTVSCGGTYAGTGSNIIVDPAAGTSMTYYVRATGTCNTTACASGTVVVLPSVGIPSTPSPTASTICQGSGNTTYTTLAANATSYTWSISGTGNTITGTGTTATVSWSPSFTGVATISVTANGCNGPSASSSTTVTVNPLPVPTLASSETDNAFCAGTSVTFTAGGGTSYNFRVNGASRQSGSSNTFTTSTLTNGQVVDVLVTNANGCSSASSGITNTVYSLPTPTLTSSDPGNDNIFCMGTTVAFVAGGGISYDFRIGGITVQNGASNTYITNTLTNGQTVSVVVTNGNGCQATSAGITNVVNTLPFIAVTSPATCAPDLLTYSLGVTVNTGTVTSTAGIVTYAGSNVWNITAIPSGTNVTVTVRDIATCESSISVTAPNCSCPVINPPATGGDKTYCAGSTIPTINATVSSGETVDWYSAATGGTLLRNASLTYTPSGAGTYYAMARNTTTNCVSTTRTPIVVTMYALPTPTLSSSDADNIFCSGTSVVFTAGGGTSFNFRINGTSFQSGSSNTFTTTSLTDGQVVDVIVTNSNGCSAAGSAITNTVLALPVPTLASSEADNIFCAGTSITFSAGGGTSYNFRVNGSSVQNSTSSTYTTNTLTNGQIVDVIVTNASGCNATSNSITNTVRALPTPTLTSSDADNIFCAGSSITFTAGGGSSYNFRVNGTSVQTGTSTTYTTSTLQNGHTVDVVVTNSNGCVAASSTITNTVDQLPEPNAGLGGNECDLTFQLNAVPSVGIGTWTRTTGPSGATATFSPSSNSPTAIATVSAYGTYTFTWTETNGTCSSGSSITVNFYRQPVASAGTGGNNCGLSFHLNGSNDIGTGIWTKVSGPGNVSFSPNANTAGATVTVSQYGPYTFRWTVLNGTCSAAPQVNVNFVEQPAANAGSGGTECDLDFQLGAVPGPSSGSWATVSGPGNVAFSPNENLYNAEVTVDQFGTYIFSWTTVNVTCQSTDTITVGFHPLPQVNAGRDTIICEDGSAQLKATGTGTFAWTPANDLSDPAIANPVATPDATTTFTVTLTDRYGCQNSDNVNVEVRNIPVIDAGPDKTLEYLFSTDLEATPLQVHETGTWSVTDGEGQFTKTDEALTRISGLALGENIVLWRVDNGVCQPVDDYVVLTVNDLFIPSLITPNGDPFNQYFFIQGIETLGVTELVIFDRRGAQVYRNRNYDNTWDGKDYNDNDLPDDTYFYVIKSQNGKSLSGFVVIRR